MTATSFIARHGLTLKSNEVGGNRHARGRAPAGTRHYECRLYRTGGSRMSVTYSMAPGFGHGPRVRDVLESLQAEALIAESPEGLGLSPAEVGALERQAERLKRFMGGLYSDFLDDELA